MAASRVMFLAEPGGLRGPLCTRGLPTPMVRFGRAFPRLGPSYDAGMTLHRFTFAAITAVCMATAACNVPDGAPGPDPRPTSSTAPTEASEPPSSKELAAEFAAFVEENGTPQEKDAVKHVVKVQITGEGRLVSATVTTDFEADLMDDTARTTGKVIATAFADWKQSESGSSLVTVNSANGSILANGNF